MRNEKGFTLIEIMVSLVIFLLVASAAATAFQGNIRFNHEFEKRSEAVQAAQQVLDELRVQDPTSLPNGGGIQTSTVTFGTRNYVVRVVFCPGGNPYCTNNNIRYLTTTVTFNGTNLYAVDTVFAQLR